MPKYRYTGSHSMVCLVNDTIAEVSPGQIIEVAEAPTSEFQCLDPVKKEVPKAKAPQPTKKTGAPKKVVQKTKEVKNASTTQTSGLG
jgi:hypothetical protein